MKRASRLTCALSLVMTVWGACSLADEPFQPGSFRQACALAAKSKRIVLVDFYTTWCGPCKRLDAVTWKDKSVRAWLAKTAVCRKVDAEKETALASRYKIQAYPTILLVRPDGKEIDRLVGFREPQTFLTEARQALAGQDSVARARAKLNGAGAHSPMARMAYARALQEKGRNAEALKEYLWCFDEGNKHDVGFTGVRLSFLLSDIQGLGRDYPPAVDALKKRRDASRTALEKGAAPADAAMDFSSLNEQLGDQELTLTVYDDLKKRGSASADALFEMVVDLLIEKKRYADLVNAAGNIGALVDREISIYKMLLVGESVNKETLAFMKGRVVEKVSTYFEALAGANKLSEAEAVRDKLILFDGGVSTYVALARHAARAGNRDAVAHLIALAKTRLAPAEVQKVEQEAK